MYVVTPLKSSASEMQNGGLVIKFLSYLFLHGNKGNIHGVMSPTAWSGLGRSISSSQISKSSGWHGYIRNMHLEIENEWWIDVPGVLSPAFKHLNTKKEEFSFQLPTRQISTNNGPETGTGCMDDWWYHLTCIPKAIQLLLSFKSEPCRRYSTKRQWKAT